jgi:hypothetical protein
MNKTDQRQARLGYLYVSLAAILFAISGTFAKFLFNGGITAFQLIQMRTTLAFVGLHPPFHWVGHVGRGGFAQSRFCKLIPF